LNISEKIMPSKESYYPAGSERERIENKFKDIILDRRKF